ncbi:MAG: DUF3137 domain-containing protein [Mycobacteriales bacterium]|nr:DUF3137 domain-containing protein [Frankia sp.]
MLPILVLLAAMAVIGGLAYLQFRADERRRVALKQLAAAKGWAYRPYDPSLTSRWVGRPFGEGFDRQAANVVSGVVRGLDLVAFDYRYKERTTDAQGHSTTTTHRYAVCALHLPTILPEIHVTTENVLTRLGNAVGFEDIELESDAFNRRFRVQSRDRKFACDVLTPRTMEALLANPLEFRLELSDVVTWWDGRLQPLEILRRAATLARVVDGVPEFVWKDHGYDPVARAARGGGGT